LAAHRRPAFQLNLCVHAYVLRNLHL